MDNLIIRSASEMQEGAGARVKRLMPLSRQFMNFDPFVLWDHFQISPGSGFPDHPHRGFEAITYLFSGSICHSDDLGNRATVTAGGAQRFTAGRGITHSEMPAEDGITEGIQLWINLAKAQKGIDPAYQQADHEQIPERVIENGTLRTIVGDGGAIALHTPVDYLDIQLQANGRYRHDIPAGWRGLAYVVSGEARIAQQRVAAERAAFFEGVEALTIEAEQACRVMLCAGQSHGEPIRQWGPFVD